MVRPGERVTGTVQPIPTTIHNLEGHYAVTPQGMVGLEQNIPLIAAVVLRGASGAYQRARRWLRE